MNFLNNKNLEPLVISIIFITLFIVTSHTNTHYDVIRNLVVSQETQMRGIPTYFDSVYWQHTPLLNYMIAGVSSMTGTHVHIAGMLVVLVLSFFSLFFFYKLCSELKDERFARMATVILGVTPIYWYWSNEIMHEIPQLFFFITTSYFFYLAIKRSKNRYFYLSGVLLGFAMLLKNSNVIIIPVILALVLFEKRKEAFSRKTIMRVIYMFIIAGLIFSPYFIYRSANGAPSLLGERAFQEIVSGKAEWAEGGDISMPFHYYVTSIFDIFSFGTIFLVLGLYHFYRKRDKSMWLPLLWLIFSYLILSIFAHKVYRYMIIAVPAMVIIAVYGLYYIKNKRLFYIATVALVAALAAHSVYFNMEAMGSPPLEWEMWDYLRGLDNNVLSQDLYEYSTIDMAYGMTKIMTGRYSDIATKDPQNNINLALIYNTPYILYVGRPDLPYPYTEEKYFGECNCTLFKIDEDYLFGNKSVIMTTSGGKPLEGVDIYLTDQNGNVVYRSKSNIKGEAFIPAEKYTGLIIAEKICYEKIQTYVNIEGDTFQLCEVKQQAGAFGVSENYLECRPSESLDLKYKGCFAHGYERSRF